MEGRIPFGFVAEGERDVMMSSLDNVPGGRREIQSYIVQEGVVYVQKAGGRWEQLSDYPFPARKFWEEIAECIEKDKRFRAERKLIRNDFECPPYFVSSLVDELVCRDAAEEKIDLLMDRRVYNRLAYRNALNFVDIGTHHGAMRGHQALLFNGAYFRVGFSRVLPLFRISRHDLVKIQVVVLTAYQAKVEFPVWCESGRYDIHLRR